MTRSPPGAFPEIRKTAPRHITWHKVKAYTAIYRRGKTRVTIKSVIEPPPTRLFRTAGGVRKFKRTALKTTTREVIIVARTKGRKKPVDTEELEELEALEELEDLDEDEVDEEDEEELEDDEDVEDEEEDEDEPEDEEDEDEEEEEPAPKRSRSKKSASTTAKAKRASGPKQSRAAANGKVGTQEVAEHFGTDGRTLRIVLRKHSIPKDEDSGRYEWSSLKHPQVIKIGKLLKGGAAKEAKQEGLSKLKSSKAKKTSSSAGTKTAAKKTAGKTTRRRTRS